jgi:hypothetical protein
MQDRGAILNLFVKGVGTGKDVMHAGKSVWVVGSGETGVSSILVRLVMKECVFYLQGVSSRNMEQVLATRIAPCNAVWSKCLLVLIAGAHANSCIYVTTHNNLCAGADDTNHRIKKCTELVMSLIFAREVDGDESHQH